jgi:UDP-galactopyranose mutase
VDKNRSVKAVDIGDDNFISLFRKYKNKFWSWLKEGLSEKGIRKVNISFSTLST